MELNGAKILYTIHTNIPLLGDFKITQTLVSTWIVMALLSGLAIWLGHGLKLENVSKRQAVAEFIVTRLDQFVHGTTLLDTFPLLSVRNYIINQTVCFCFLCGHIVVTLGIDLNLFQRFSCICRQNFI